MPRRAARRRARRARQAGQDWRRTASPTELGARGIDAASRPTLPATFFVPDAEPRRRETLRRLRALARHDATDARRREPARRSSRWRRRRPPRGRIRVDPSLARGLSYYTGAIMEIAVPDLAGSLGGGGRYDNLIGMFLGRDVPACGFSLGLERIIVVMTERDMFPATVVARRRRRDGRALERAIARRRAGAGRASCAPAGFASTCIPRPTSSASSSSTRRAGNVPFVAIVGDDERAHGDGVDQGPAERRAADRRRAARRRAARATAAIVTDQAVVTSSERRTSQRRIAPIPAARCAPSTSARRSAWPAGCIASAITASCCSSTCATTTASRSASSRPTPSAFAVAEAVRARERHRRRRPRHRRARRRTSIPRCRPARSRSCVDAIEVLSPAETLPFQVAGTQEIPEEQRLRYRFLDLRREKMHANIVLRSQVISSIRRRMQRAGLPRVPDADPDVELARRARATTSCRAASIPASSTRCRRRRSSSSSC